MCKFFTCHISQVFVAFPLQTFSTIFMEFLPLSFENSRNFLPVIIIRMFCVKAPYAPDRLLEFSLLPSSMCYDRFKKYTVLMSKKKQKRSLDRDTGKQFLEQVLFSSLILCTPFFSHAWAWMRLWSLDGLGWSREYDLILITVGAQSALKQGGMAARWPGWMIKMPMASLFPSAIGGWR